MQPNPKKCLQDSRPLIKNPPDADLVLKNLDGMFASVADSEEDILAAQVKLRLDSIVSMHAVSRSPQLAGTTKSN